MSSKKLRVELHYWDTCNFLTILKNDSNGIEGCKDVLNEAKNGKLKIVTSSLALAGIVKLESQGRPAQLKSEDSKKIKEFFMHEYFIFRDLDRKTAEIARELSWELGIQSFDAIHVATAIRAKVDYFETLDTELIKKIINKIGEPKILVRKPHLTEKQTDLFDKL